MVNPSLLPISLSLSFSRLCFIYFKTQICLCNTTEQCTHFEPECLWTGSCRSRRRESDSRDSPSRMGENNFRHRRGAQGMNRSGERNQVIQSHCLGQIKVAAPKEAYLALRGDWIPCMARYRSRVVSRSRETGGESSVPCVSA